MNTERLIVKPWSCSIILSIPSILPHNHHTNNDPLKNTFQPTAGRGCYRVNGNLALSRTVGDYAERPYVSGEAELKCSPTTHEDEFIIVATDGLFDVLSSEAAVSFVSKLIKQPKFAKSLAASSPLISSALVAEGLRKGSSDNISACVLFLK